MGKPDNQELLPAIRDILRDLESAKVRDRLLRKLKDFDLEKVQSQRDIAARYAFLADVMAECAVQHKWLRKWCNDQAKLLGSFTDAYTKWVSCELPLDLKAHIERLEAEFDLFKGILKEEVDKGTFEKIMKRFDLEKHH